MPLLLIDGYNVLLVAGRGANQAAREQLVRLAAHYRGMTGHDVVIVFDASTGSGTESRTPYPGVRVQYAGDADTEIVARVRRQRNPSATVVVTSDRELGQRVRSFGARTQEGRWLLARVTAAASQPHEKPTSMSADELEYWLQQFAAPRSDHEFNG